jgi:hypothetical protein
MEGHHGADEDGEEGSDPSSRCSVSRPVKRGVEGYIVVEKLMLVSLLNLKSYCGYLQPRTPLYVEDPVLFQCQKRGHGSWVSSPTHAFRILLRLHIFVCFVFFSLSFAASYTSRSFFFLRLSRACSHSTADELCNTWHGMRLMALCRIDRRSRLVSSSHLWREQARRVCVSYASVEWSTAAASSYHAAQRLSSSNGRLLLFFFSLTRLRCCFGETPRPL